MCIKIPTFPVELDLKRKKVTKERETVGIYLPSGNTPPNNQIEFNLLSK